MSQAFNNLKVVKKIAETHDSASFLIEVPTELKEQYEYKAGQYLTVKVNIQEEECRRAYSIFVAPFENKFGFTVKRLQGGKVSNFLIDNISEGDLLEIMTPEGRFILEADAEHKRDHYFIAGGSGITPVMAMIKTVLEEEPMSKAYLLYCNRNEDSIIFKEDLEALEAKYKGQFVVKHNLSQPYKEKAGGLKGLLGKKKSNWGGWKGRLNATKISEFLEENPSISKNNHYYLCGPGGLIETSETYIKSLGTSTGNIHKEYFISADSESKAFSSEGVSGCHAEVQLNGETFDIAIPSDKTVLEALLDAGKDAPYSCTSGACSTCVARITEGEVEMDACFALDEEEINSGLVLTCQSRAKTGKLKLVFEN